MVNSVHIFSHALTKVFSNCAKSGNIPDILKYADITPVFKKGDTTDKNSYWPISTLSNFSKVFEKLIYNQINSFMEPKLSKYLAGFRKNHNTQHALLKMIQTCRSMLNKGAKVGAIVMNLSKAFDTLNLNLLLCKLKAYGFDTNALTFIQRYFSSRRQRTKVGDKFSKWQNISTGVPQGSILGPLLFNIFINDLFLFIETTTLYNYADDNTMYSSDKNANIVISRLRHDFAIISEWVYENYMVLNADKCHYLTIGFNEPFPDFSFNDTIIENINEEKILGIVIVNKS